MLSTSLIALIPLLPVISFVLIALVGKRYFPSLCGVLGTLCLLVAFILSATVAYDYFFVVGKVGDAYQQLVPLKVNWLQFTPTASIDIGILLDPISVMMLVVVTLVSLMVHLYSLGYMKGEERYAAFYSFLGLFTFSMLGLVLSSNIFQIYIFWELVGVSSYLLIGYYFDRPSAVAAAKKAFIVTRFADLGFLIGILVLSYYSGTLDFQTMITKLTTNTAEFHSIAAASFMGVSALTWGLLLVFIGGAGKSAMFPLHIWLPDAMEGPTPVSALIHAATMVVAGVFLVARLFPVFSISGTALDIVMWVGVSSSLIAAVIACTQTDIKRVLAYSTMSQIGYMMFSLGLARYGGEHGLGYMASMFHLFTHAMFKALLFLGAGAVIHYVHSNEMGDMGGLRKKMPVTHVTFLIACLAIAGIPPFAGFFSKEEILQAAWHSNKMIFVLAIVTAAITAFYMFRLYFSIFWNKEYHTHGEGHDEHHHGEAPGVMLLPLIILGLLSVGAGFIPFGHLVTSDGKVLPTEFHLTFSIAPVLLATLGIVIALSFYKKESTTPQRIANGVKGFYRGAYNKFYIDELYLFVTKKVLFPLVGQPAAWIDRNIVDGFMNLLAKVTEQISFAIKKMQSGKTQHYAAYFFVGVIGFVLVFIYWWT